jgi:hypothetical protein
MERRSRGIADCQLPIADLEQPNNSGKSTIRNWQSAMNLVGDLDWQRHATESINPL